MRFPNRTLRDGAAWFTRDVDIPPLWNDRGFSETFRYIGYRTLGSGWWLT